MHAIHIRRTALGQDAPGMGYEGKAQRRPTVPCIVLSPAHILAQYAHVVGDYESTENARSAPVGRSPDGAVETRHLPRAEWRLTLPMRSLNMQLLETESTIA